jgi:predicted Zn-dependent protease
MSTPQELVEQALDASTTNGCIAIVTNSATANLRWANNTLTTNGVSETVDLTVIATVDGSDGVRAGAVSRSGATTADVADVVAAAEATARASVTADDAADLVPGRESPGWADGPVDVPLGDLADVAGWLGDTFGAARDAGQGRSGYVEHDVSTTYLASSTGLRLRHVQPAVRLEMTGRSDDGSKSAWAGQGTASVSALDLQALEADLRQQLAWSERRVDLDAGRYETILPPSAVADLFIYAYWNSGALDAHEGQSVFSATGGGTRVGERLTDVPLTLRSDPQMTGQESSPFLVTGASSRMASVFDNGSPIAPTDWIHDGELAALIQTRHSSRLTSLPFTPFGDNLELISGGPTSSVQELVADTERGLLVTCLWYVREVDPQTLLLTGLTRDGVFLVENGEVTAAVNNYRFNESPIGMLKRVNAVGDTQPTLAREFGDYFTRTRMPALRVESFNMSTVSQAS